MGTRTCASSGDVTSTRSTLSCCGFENDGRHFVVEIDHENLGVQKNVGMNVAIALVYFGYGLAATRASDERSNGAKKNGRSRVAGKRIDTQDLQKSRKQPTTT
jgi:hypothetical protein